MSNNKFELTILGCNSAMPSHGRWPTSQVLNLAEDLILIDAGEGCQIRMAQYKIKRNRISHVLISHLHGDHIYGLPGFIGSLAHLSRKQDLIIIGPHGIREYVETCLRLSGSYVPYELKIREISSDDSEFLVDMPAYTITSFPVSHRLPTYGYLIKEKVKERNIIKEKITELGLTREDILLVKAGEDLTINNKCYANSELTHPQPEARSYAYCADTTKEGWKMDHLKNVSLLYYESTYLHELVDLAHERKHTTAKEAGEIARELGVGQLIIGHYSSRYRDVTPLLDEAKKEFQKTVLAQDGFIINI